MRISLVTPSFLPHLGGIENHVAALAAHLSGIGHRVTVGTQVRGARGAPSSEVTGAGVRVLRFPAGPPIRGHGLAPGLWNWIRLGADEADVVHIHGAHALTSMVAAAATRKALVVTPHYLGRGDSQSSRALHAVYDVPLKLALRRSRAIICTTHSEAVEFASDVGYGTRCTIIPNGVETRPRVGPTVDVPPGALVVMAGRLEAYKQPHLLVEALGRLPEHRLALVGTGPAEPSLRQLVLRLGIADRVHFPGRLAPDQVYAWYRAADVVASLSRRECFGMTLAEGLSAGANVLASDIGPHRDVLGLVDGAPAALIPPDATPDDVATAIRELGRRRSGPPPVFPTWTAVAEEVSRLYASVTGPHGHPRATSGRRVPAVRPSRRSVRAALDPAVATGWPGPGVTRETPP